MVEEEEDKRLHCITVPEVVVGVASFNQNVFPILPPILFTQNPGSVTFLECSFIPFFLTTSDLETEVQRLALVAPEVSPGSLGAHHV